MVDVTEIEEFIADEIAGLTRIVSVPTEPLGYGVDIACSDDVDEAMSETDPASGLGVSQWILRLLNTEHGSLPGETAEESDFGFDLLSLLAVGLDAARVRDVERGIRNAIQTDDRIEFLDVALTDGGEGEWAISIEGNTIEGVAFDLVVAVDSDGVWLKAVNR